MEEPSEGLWVCPQEPTQLDAEAMLEVAPKTWMWITPAETYLAPQPPTGGSWN